MKKPANKSGDYFEDRALDFLRRQGLVLLERNYRKKFGEIDLVMRHGEQLVFIEVKYRRSGDYGLALEQVNRRKQQRIVKAAKHYLLLHRDPAPCRFDVLAISGAESLRYNWVQDAFQA